MKAPYTLILAMVLTLAGCHGNRDARDALLQADRLIDTQPDSALTILENLDCREADRETQAWHALLLAKANEKALKRFRNDSLTSMAAEHFRGRGDR